MTFAVIRREAVLLMVAATFVTFLSGTTSPFRPWYGGDSALFRVIGTAMAEGAVLYLDVWDHKGPVLFLFQWLGQELVPGRIGIFLVQIALLYASLSMIASFARRFVGGILTAAVVAGSIAYLAPAYEHGNLSEEFSLPFVILALVLITREWVTERDSAVLWFAVAGAAFAFVAFIRINNALPIFAGFVAYFAWALLRRRPFAKRLLWSLAGFFVIVLVFVVGFALVGALPAMLDATFLFNFRYARNDSVAIDRLFANGYVYVAIVGVLIPLIGGFVDAQVRQRRGFLLLGWCLAAATALALLLSSTGYFHYLQIAVPGVGLGLALIMQAVGPRQRLQVLVATLIVAVSLFTVTALREASARDRANEPAYSADVGDILSPVPARERDGVYAWNVQPRFFLVADILPIQRYFTMQEWWGSADDRVLQEALGFIDTAKPEWIVSSSVSDPRMADILARDYREVSRNGNFVLYERVTTS